MKFSSNLAWGLLSIISVVLIMLWSTYLVKNGYIIECFGAQSVIDEGKPETSHNVNLVNSPYNCRNMCGPLGRCSITSEQCMNDVDCTGCQTPENIVKDLEIKPYQKLIKGQNDAGKLGPKGNVLSTLTTDIGTQATLTGPDYLKPAPEYTLGVNTWRSHFDDGMELYQKRYEPKDLEQLINYPSRFTLSGEFKNSEPIAANGFINQPFDKNKK